MISITNAFKISNCCRNIINSCRQNVPLINYQQAAGLKTVEEKVGLPPKPKKPLTPYFRFMKQIRPTVTTENPKASVLEIIKIIATKWEKVDEATKKKLQEDYKRDQISYVDIRAKYDSKITDQQRSEMKQIKQQQSENKERRAMKKRVRELGRPKKPASGFLKFISKEREASPQAPNQSYKEWHLNTSEKWSKLTDAQKQVYLSETKKELEKYKKEMSKWEEKMVRLGHIDVVRHDALIDPPEPKHKSKNVSKQ